MRFLMIGCAVLAASACMVTQVPIQSDLVVSATPSPVYRLAAPVTLRASSSADQMLRSGTTWTRTGAIPQGDVFHTKDQVVIVNSFSVFEADVVVKDGMAVGYFIPVGRSFVAATPVAINLTVEDGK